MNLCPLLTYARTIPSKPSSWVRSILTQSNSFRTWLDEAIHAQLLEPNAMTLATVDESGQPSARVVLLKGLDERGFVFYSNYESRKAQEIEGNAKVALVFNWLGLGATGAGSRSGERGP